MASVVSFFPHFFFDSTFLDIPLIPHNSLWVKNKVILNNCGDACECIGNIDGDKEVGELDLILLNQDGRRKDCTQQNPCNGDLEILISLLKVYTSAPIHLRSPLGQKEI